jgi:HD-like signal output (HDOD) protein
MFFDDEIHPLTPPTGEDPKPWLKGKPAQQGTWSEVLKGTCDALKALEETQTHPGNRLFLVRLVKDIKTEDMKLPAFPLAVKQVDHMMRRDIADAFKFSKLLETDPALEHAVWYHANSVQYSRPASSFRGAIARLSQVQMWRLITQVGIESAVWHVPHMEHWVSRQKMHAAVVAEVSAHLVQEAHCTEYVCGLLHGIGRLSIYRAAVRHRRSPAPESTFVEQIANEYYATIGVLVARCWDLDPVITGAIAHHNSPNDANPESKKAAWMIYLANIIAHTAMAEAEGLDSDGREVLEKMRGVRFNIEEAFDVAHDALSESEAFQAAQQANAEEQSA